MLYCPLGAKTWVGRSKIFLFFVKLFFFFLFPFWAGISQFWKLWYFFLSKKRFKKKEKKKPNVDFKIFGSVAKGNQYNIFFFSGLIIKTVLIKRLPTKSLSAITNKIQWQTITYQKNKLQYIWNIHQCDQSKSSKAILNKCVERQVWNWLTVWQNPCL